MEENSFRSLVELFYIPRSDGSPGDNGGGEESVDLCLFASIHVQATVAKHIGIHIDYTYCTYHNYRSLLSDVGGSHTYVYYTVVRLNCSLFNCSISPYFPVQILLC